jgi:hypothetical protein
MEQRAQRTKNMEHHIKQSAWTKTAEALGSVAVTSFGHHQPFKKVDRAASFQAAVSVERKRAVKQASSTLHGVGGDLGSKSSRPRNSSQ